MCGIVGYIGRRQASKILLDGLSRLEYRGYDSAGLAVRDGTAEPVVVKAKGKLSFLREKTDDGESVPGCVGIGHTRWATHGEPSETNAHPHISDSSENVIAVHNGIIENHQELREKLLRHGYSFYSGTDTEVAVKLIDYYYNKYKIGPVDAINRTMVRVRGSYALAVMFRDYPEEIFVARKDSPLVIGVTDDETFVASDVPAILSYTRNVYYIGNLEIGRLGAGKVTFYNLDGDEIQKETVEIKWDAAAAEKGGFEHFMMKEIHEQPAAVEQTLRAAVNFAEAGIGGNAEGRVLAESGEGPNENGGSPAIPGINYDTLGITPDELAEISQIYIIACGSAAHVGFVSQYDIEQLTGVPVRVEYASEFRYRELPITRGALAVVISQSGETADSLEGLRKAKANGMRTLAIVNVVGSTIAREADHVFYTLAGPEIAVATTKAYSAQLIAMYILAVALGLSRGTIDRDTAEKYLAELATIPGKIARILEDKERLQWFAAKYSMAHDVFFIGRGIDYAICMEGSLKLKEISYIHSEAYGAGELKHGTISLIEDGTLVIGVLTQPSLFEKTLSNMVEARSRGGYLMALTNNGNYSVEDTANFTVYIPKTDPHFAASLAIVPLQLIAYYVSVAKGLDVDKPRNLAKSVTVE